MAPNINDPDDPERTALPCDIPTLHLNKEEREALLAEINRASAENKAKEGITCPNCGLTNAPGSVACARCNAPIVQTTVYFGPIQEESPAVFSTGEVIVTDQETIVLTIFDQQIVLPLAASLVVGRGSPDVSAKSSFIDLNPFGAQELGVSRRHLEIRREKLLIQVEELGSTNGTLLNGRHLIPHAPRLLRSGDELQLSRLKIKVHF